MKVASQTLWGAIRTIESNDSARRRPTSACLGCDWSEAKCEVRDYVALDVRRNNWQWLACVWEDLLSRSARALDSQCPELETSLFQHLICFAAWAPCWECGIWMLFSSPRETLNRIRTGEGQVLWSLRLSSLWGMLVFGYYKGKFDTFHGVVVVRPRDANEQMVLWFEGLWDTDIPMNLVFKDNVFLCYFCCFWLEESMKWYQCWYWHF